MLGLVLCMVLRHSGLDLFKDLLVLVITLSSLFSSSLLSLICLLFLILVADPYYAVKEEGWSNLGKGMASGLTGLVTKPAAGMLSMVSKTAEGIKATTDSRDSRTQRVRLPRLDIFIFVFVGGRKKGVFPSSLNSSLNHFFSLLSSLFLLLDTLDQIGCCVLMTRRKPMDKICCGAVKRYQMKFIWIILFFLLLEKKVKKN